MTNYGVYADHAHPDSDRADLHLVFGPESQDACEKEADRLRSQRDTEGKSFAAPMHVKPYQGDTAF